MGCQNSAIGSELVFLADHLYWPMRPPTIARCMRYHRSLIGAEVHGRSARLIAGATAQLSHAQITVFWAASPAA
jgi:hypothetical protein